MEKQCEFLDQCGFYKNFSGNVEAVRNGWIRMFCSELKKSERCQRKKIRQETGNPPPDNMAPTGQLCG